MKIPRLTGSWGDRTCILILSVVINIACSGAPKGGAAAPGGSNGVINVAFTLPDGEIVTTVAYTLADGEGISVRSGTVDISNRQSISFQLGNVAPSGNDTISLSASTPNGTTCSGTSGPFQVAPRATTTVMVNMACYTPDGKTGNVAVTGNPYNCATWQSLATGVGGSEANVGDVITLIATATAPDPNNLTFTWTSDSKVITVGLNQSVGGTNTVTLTCQATGTATITLVVRDGTLPDGSACESSRSTVTTTVTCDPAASADGGSAGATGAPPPLAVALPHTLPAPPTQLGCYIGSPNGWVPVPCTPAGQLSSEFQPPDVEPDIASMPPSSGGATIPFQFGQVEATIVTIGSESDSTQGENSLSIQGNTNFFPGPNSHRAWVQFVVQVCGDSCAATNEMAVCIWNIDTTTNVYYSQCLGGGPPSTTGQVFNAAKRPGAFHPFDYATVAGSTYLDDHGNAVLGMVSQLSFYDPANDPQDSGGLYAVVATDLFGLAGQWTNMSGTLLGMGGGSVANFMNASVLTRDLAGSCANASGPEPAVPWPGECPTEPSLLPNTGLDTIGVTAENTNLCQVGSPVPLAALSADLVSTQYLRANPCECLPGGDRAFVRTVADDTGNRPLNIGVQPFWESPDIFVVPQGAAVDLNAVSTQTLVTPGNSYDAYIRVNNDFGCDPVTGVKALVYLANPSALSVEWASVTGGQFVSDANDPNGVTIPAGGRALIGPLSFTAPASGYGNGDRCVMAAILADGEPAPANTTDPTASYQVAQRNLQFEDCAYPLTNATTSNASLQIALSVAGVTPSTSGSTDIEMTFDDPLGLWLRAWQPGAGAAYTVTSSNGKTTVRLGQPSILLAPVTLGAGASVSAVGTLTFLGTSNATLRLAATLRDAAGNVLVANGGSCVGQPVSG